jgi:invasion protein IalB
MGKHMKRGFAAGRARLRTRMWAAGVLVAALAPLTAVGQQSQLPGGAQSITETYQDWQMVCGQPQGVKQCAVAQQQTDSKSGQRILGVELRPQGDKAEGILLLPFGLTLDKGVALRIGEAEIAAGLRFKTCLIAGCVVPLSFDAKTVSVLRKAAAFSVSAFGDADQPMTFSVSLKGFSPAFDRAAALAH